MRWPWTRRRQQAVVEEIVTAVPNEEVQFPDPIELRVGYALIPSVHDRVFWVRTARRDASLRTGVPVPPVRIRDDVLLEPDSYLVRVRGVDVITRRTYTSDISEHQAQMQAAIEEALERQIAELLTFESVESLLNRLENRAPVTVSLIRKQLGIPELYNLLYALLKEGRSIKDLEMICARILAAGTADKLDAARAVAPEMAAVAKRVESYVRSTQ